LKNVAALIGRSSTLGRAGPALGDLTKEEEVLRTVKRGKPFNACRHCMAIAKAKSDAKNFGKCKIHGVLEPEQTKANGRCRICHRSSANTKRNENREWFNEKLAKKRAEDPEKWEEIFKKAHKTFRDKYGSQWSLKKVCYERGITLEDYQKMLKKQDDKCIICFQPETRISGRTNMPMRLVIDHCHKTNKVRGLLCHSCNTAIGKFRDDPCVIVRAARYVKQGGF
jgi:hypothetical protein